jgi:hypothetical protein
VDTFEDIENELVNNFQHNLTDLEGEREVVIQNITGSIPKVIKFEIFFFLMSPTTMEEVEKNIK